MKQEYYLIDKSVLPEIFSKVIEAKKLLRTGQYKTINDATKAVMYKGIERACRSIIKRNVSVGYTNVCIADSFITVAAGEMLGLEELIEYGTLRKRICGELSLPQLMHRKELLRGIPVRRYI
jgi:hypothetical protein